MSVYRHKRKKAQAKKAATAAYRSVSNLNFGGMGHLVAIIQGASEVFAVLPTNRVELAAKTIPDRIHKTWVRTGGVVQLAIDEYIEEYEDNPASLNPQDTTTQQLQDATL